MDKVENLTKWKRWIRFALIDDVILWFMSKSSRLSEGNEYKTKEGACIGVESMNNIIYIDLNMQVKGMLLNM